MKKKKILIIALFCLSAIGIGSVQAGILVTTCGIELMTPGLAYYGGNVKEFCDSLCTLNEIYCGVRPENGEGLYFFD
jgi:hypothetical protein